MKRKARYGDALTDEDAATVRRRRERSSLLAPTKLSTATLKYCSRHNDSVGAMLPRSEFGANRSAHDGLQSICRACTNAYQRIRDEKKRAEQKAQRESQEEVKVAATGKFDIPKSKKQTISIEVERGVEDYSFDVGFRAALQAVALGLIKVKKIQKA